MKLAFGFPAIEQTRHKIAEIHWRTDEPPPLPSGSIVDQLLQRIAATPPSALKALALSLRRAERIAAVHGLQVAEGSALRQKVAVLLTSNPRIEFLSAGWRVATNHCHDRQFMETMRAVVELTQHKFPEANVGELGIVSARLTAEDPSKQLLGELEQSGRDYTSWLEEHERGVAAMPHDSLAGALLRRRLLLDGSPDLLGRHEGAQLLRWSDELREGDFEAFARAYLVKVPFVSWHGPILDRIVDRFGLPAGGNAFWQSIPEPIRLTVQRAVAERRLDEFFTGVFDPEERYAFWRRFVDNMTEVLYPKSREHVILYFGPFLVVEFRDTGNAAYFYEQGHSDWVKRVHHQGIYSLKDRSRCHFRLIHGTNWQHRMAGLMPDLLRGDFRATLIARGLYER